jgi:hypothetical protein
VLLPPAEFFWCTAGAVAGFIFNAKAKEYIGVSDVFSRYKVKIGPVTLLFVDVVFFCILGPIIVMGMYQPAAVYQAVSLGLGWPFVVRGALRGETSERSIEGPPHG